MEHKIKLISYDSELDRAEFDIDGTLVKARLNSVKHYDQVGCGYHMGFRIDFDNKLLRKHKDYKRIRKVCLDMCPIWDYSRGVGPLFRPDPWACAESSIGYMTLCKLVKIGDKSANELEE